MCQNSDRNYNTLFTFTNWQLFIEAKTDNKNISNVNFCLTQIGKLS